MKIVVGLGNPGRKYTGTRHNVGFEVVEILAKRFSTGTWQSRFEAQTVEIPIGSERVLLVAPQTFMNLSGRSVRSIVGFFKSSLEDLLVICDDLNLPVGQLRLRTSGSAGGQKGLKNTIEQLGTEEFARLRIGIGRPGEGQDTVNYVLQSFAKSERPAVEQAVDRAASAVETWALEGPVVAMNLFNRSPQADG
ncbi:aminoacyl-tRNA hydrolase [Planctomicrobium sp. SH664]|uniref:aminoacyl-tRNA hydrolase n=1 Tax=Planctomicrobium sp. SH664 TaxID=3448125 RepID=UPI003F5C1A5B